LSESLNEPLFRRSLRLNVLVLVIEIVEDSILMEKSYDHVRRKVPDLNLPFIIDIK
jgi:hypothetical protein